ncbi:AEL242Wp [Eremothecium gossypii ATCC 10895]|uniref:AEL242Wp n=1 Tax=Eremothecium gossypii (strain ATCC 10895 / CBS 109.51 / FGSC 9923 / NRRL Y-1056) TaxID=284811 RepID=Q758K4_EREGS|nr:AEL242Wp [Eremothecium gossypii ATCC 10895]AAS52443.1 AEL242Wp [Eremothecium gossypii ATCC 10895]
MLHRVTYPSSVYDGTLSINKVGSFLYGTDNIPQRLLLCGTLALSYYILGPTIYTWLFPGSSAMFQSSTRKDKHTTGLANNRNDCFANSSIQAWASLPAVSVYLNEIMEIRKEVLRRMVRSSDGAHDGAAADEWGEVKAPSPEHKSEAHDMHDSGDHVGQMNLSNGVDVRMHAALADILYQLQQPVAKSTFISLQPLLHTLELIYSAKLSRGQNDAHEFTQLLLETLEKEHTELSLMLKGDKRLEGLAVPAFPIRGSLADNLVCLRCGGSSKVNVHQFSMHTLPVPNATSADLRDMLFDNQTETIDDYTCVSCQIRAILATEKNRGRQGVDSTELAIIEELARLAPSISINEDMPPHLAAYVSAYNKDHCITAALKSTIVKRTVSVDSPRVLILHLSRSVFNGVSYAKNTCNVTFPEELVINEQLLENNKCVGVRAVRYKLCAMIKHIGTHSQGHYACFRHKPDFRKDPRTGEIIIRSDVISSDAVPQPAPRMPVPYASSKPSALGRLAALLKTVTGEPPSTVTTNEEPVSKPDASAEQDSSGASSASSSGVSSAATKVLPRPQGRPRKLKALRRTTTHPWWCISDSYVSECKTSFLLSETKLVYMLYYQRIEP